MFVWAPGSWTEYVVRCSVFKRGYYELNCDDTALVLQRVSMQHVYLNAAGWMVFGRGVVMVVVANNIFQGSGISLQVWALRGARRS